MTNERKRRISRDAPIVALDAADSTQSEPDGQRAPDPLAFEEALGRLDETVSSLEHDKLPLEEAIRLFEEGVRLAQRCQQLLDRAELRVQRLVAESDHGTGGLGDRRSFTLEDFDLDVSE